MRVCGEAKRYPEAYARANQQRKVRPPEPYRKRSQGNGSPSTEGVVGSGAWDVTWRSVAEALGSARAGICVSTVWCDSSELRRCEPLVDTV